MDLTLDSIPHLESSSWVSTYEPLPPLAGSPMPSSIMSSPKLELKPLLDSLKDVVLGPKRLYVLLIFSFVL